MRTGGSWLVMWQVLSVVTGLSGLGLTGAPRTGRLLSAPGSGGGWGSSPAGCVPPGHG